MPNWRLLHELLAMSSFSQQSCHPWNGLMVSKHCLLLRELSQSQQTSANGKILPEVTNGEKKGISQSSCKRRAATWGVCQLSITPPLQCKQFYNGKKSEHGTHRSHILTGMRNKAWTVHWEWWSVECWNSERAKGKQNNLVSSCGSRAQLSCESDGHRPPAWQAARSISDICFCSRSAPKAYAEHPTFTKPWLPSTSKQWLTKQDCGRSGEGGRVAGCFRREVPFCLIFSQSVGLAPKETGNQPRVGVRCHSCTTPVNTNSDVFSTLLPAPEALILIQFFNPLHKYHLLHPLCVGPQ